MMRVEIYETGQTFDIPTSWDEMPPEAVQYAFREHEECIRKGRSPLSFNVSVLCHLLKIRPTRRGWTLARLSPEISLQMGENVGNLCEKCLGFLLEEDETTHQCRLSFDSVSNPMPSVRAGFRRLYGPGDLLQDLTFGEFRHASVAMQTFFRTGKAEDLDECVAFLYRPHSRKANRAGRKVEEVSPVNLPEMKRHASRLKPWQKNLILLWFAACLKYLQTGAVAIDGERVELGRLFSGDSDGEGSGSGYSFGWNDLAVQIAKDQTVGNMARVDEEPLFSILGIMWHNFKEQKRYEEIQKAKKSH